MLLKLKVKDFDFDKIFNSGLFYFFYDCTPERVVYFNNKFIELKFRQEGKYLLIKCSEELSGDEKRKLVARIKHCFGLNENLEEFYEICKRDKVLRRFLDRIVGTRIISAFSDFEALVGAIISQNNSYRNYRKQMFRLYKRLNFVQKNYKEAILRKLGVGYKVSYLVEVANNFGKVELEKIRGIGKYSINLFRIFQLRDYSSFYVDCLIEKIFREEYGIEGDLEKISTKLFSNYRGLAEAYLQRFFEVK